MEFNMQLKRLCYLEKYHREYRAQVS